jgi:hypothetical protein
VSREGDLRFREKYIKTLNTQNTTGDEEDMVLTLQGDGERGRKCQAADCSSPREDSRFTTSCSAN